MDWKQMMRENSLAAFPVAEMVPEESKATEWSNFPKGTPTKSSVSGALFAGRSSGCAPPPKAWSTSLFFWKRP